MAAPETMVRRTVTETIIPEPLHELQVPIENLTPYPHNPRRGNVAAIIESLKTNGQYRPIVTNRRTMQVLAGNHTLQAARELGWSTIATTFVDVDDEQAARIALVDNRVNDQATYDDSALLELLQSLPDLSGTGFDETTLEDLLDDIDLTPGDDTEPREIPADPRTNPGDLYLLGDSRLLCGDSTNQDHVARALGGSNPNLIVNDPPYGVAYVGKTPDALTIKNDTLTPEETQDLFVAALRASRLPPGGVFYATAPNGQLFSRAFSAAPDIALGTGALRQILVWAKDSLVSGHSDYQYRHELILYGWQPDGTHKFYGDRTQDSIWEIPRPTASRAHPTMKPIALFERMISNSSQRGDLVYDPFAGSGTTLIAATNLKRRAALIEIDPAYCDVIVDRWEQHTGHKAERE